MAKANPQTVEAKIASIKTMSQPDLAEQWAQLADGAPPNVPIGLFRRMVAQRIQEKRYGGLPLAIRRELEHAANTNVADTAATATRVGPGTRFVREWRGQTISVLALDDGTFDWEGCSYRSLSQIAKQVTGTHWSGPKFFGLVRRRTAGG